MSASFYDLLKYAKTGIASPGMTHYDKMRALAMAGGSKVQTLTGIPPLTFKSDGTPLISWSMKGNGQQSGTPSPQSIIMPTFCGVRTANLVNPADMMDGYFINSSGVLAESTRRCTTPIFEISGSQAVISYHTELDNVYAIVSLFANGEMISRTTTVASGTVIDISQADSIGVSFYSGNVSVYVTQSDLQVMLNSGSTALPYEPYGWKIPITCAGQTVPVYLGQTQTVRRIRKLVLTGTESWSNSGGQAPFTYKPADFTHISSNDAPYLCTHYKAIAYNDSWTANDKFMSSSAIGFRFKDSSFGSDLDAFKAYLAQQYANGTPVKVWYVLATPETGIVNEPLAKIGDYADELSSTDAAVTIPTAKGGNTLTVDTDLQPSEVSITGKIKPI